MAIEPLLADVIQQIALKLPNRRVLCLGYPDILTIGDPPPDAERQSIAKWHHWHGGIEHAEHFFGRQSLTAEYWDVTKARGPETIVDLNGAFDCADPDYVEYLDRQFGLVVDPGTSEHIFNVGNVFALLAQICSIDGYIVHANPLSMGNHGFWSLHPTAYVDFYQANGFTIEMMAELSGPLEKRIIRAVPATKRFAMAMDAVMLCVAKKVEDRPLVFPVQTKYRNNPMLKGGGVMNMIDRRISPAAQAQYYDGEPMYWAGNVALLFERRKALRSAYDSQTEAERAESCRLAWQRYRAGIGA